MGRLPTKHSAIIGDIDVSVFEGNWEDKAFRKQLIDRCKGNDPFKFQVVDGVLFNPPYLPDDIGDDWGAGQDQQRRL